MGSSVGDIAMNVGLNLATGGLYGVAKSVQGLVEGGKVKDALIGLVPGGSVLTPAAAGAPTAVQTSVSAPKRTGATEVTSTSAALGNDDAAKIAPGTAGQALAGSGPALGTAPSFSMVPAAPIAQQATKSAVRATTDAIAATNPPIPPAAQPGIVKPTPPGIDDLDTKRRLVAAQQQASASRRKQRRSLLAGGAFDSGVLSKTLGG